MEVTLATADLGPLNLYQAQCADRVDPHLLPEAEPGLRHPGLQGQMRAGVGLNDPWDRTRGAEKRLPRAPAGGPLDQAAGLRLPSAVVIRIVEGAFRPIRRAHASLPVGLSPL
jgi:hypothetical protein